MSQFASALQSFRTGNSTRDELLAALDQELTAHRTTPRTLLAILDSENSSDALPTDVRSAVTARITSWSEDKTEALNRAANAESESPETILLGDWGQTSPPPPESADRAPPTVGVGAVLQGRFKLIERVGEGGMSRVFKAIDLRRVEARSLNPFLAVKVLTVHSERYFDSIQTLGREADNLRRLTHPNIVRVIDVDRDGPTVFMTMEFLSGESLQQHLKPAKFSVMSAAQRTRIIEAIAQALEFAHRSGIVHGDLKPGNVIITESGEIKVIDFGIARFFARQREADAQSPGKNWEAISALTPPYASPEMLEDQAPDPRDDVYALACIAHEVLTGRHPFARESAVAARAAQAEVVPNAAMSGAQFRAIVHALQFERRARTASAQAFSDEFSGKRRPLWGRVSAAAAVLALAVVGTLLYLSRPADDSVAITAKPAPLTAGQVFRDCATCPLMRVLPAGTLLQGSIADPSEQPAHRVAIGAPIAFASREITVDEFQEFADEVQLNSKGCNVHDGEWRWRDDVNWDSLDDAHTTMHPVGCVSWDDAEAYAAWLARKTGQAYRLPSASEWEYAASAGESPATPLAADPAAACQRANIADQAAAQQYPGWNVIACNDRYVQSAPVGSFAANAFGLHDMIGNMFEWVQDCWNGSYEGAPADGAARLDGDCAAREMRGGSWFTAPAYLRASYRNHFEREYRSSSVGFRVVREIRR
jgi:formylglycine-generating enzyme required for sulfatase activity/predicted Ser/Thr protein kinase